MSPNFTVKINIASDHAGYELKSKLIESLAEYDFQDFGTDSSDSVDYPDFAHKLCKEHIKDPNSRSILICGSGIGMSIVANRYKEIRAALAMNPEIAALSRKHNDSNMLVLAARFISVEEALEITKTWLNTDFEAGRHQKRLDKINL